MLCTSCGYDLRGLPTEGRCPECGQQIARSLHGDRLTGADAHWFQRVCLGQRLMHVSCAIAVYGCIPALAVFPLVFSFALAQLLLAGTALLLLVGLFHVTAADPRLSLTEQPLALRRWVRGIGIAIVPLLPAKEILIRYAAASGASPVAQSAIDAVFKIAFGLGLLAEVASGLYYLGALAVRIPSPELSKRTRTVARKLSMWGAPFVVAVTITPVPKVGASINLPSTLLPYSLAVFTAIGLFWYTGSLMDVLSAYRRSLAQCRAEAKAGGSSSL